MARAAERDQDNRETRRRRESLSRQDNAMQQQELEDSFLAPFITMQKQMNRLFETTLNGFQSPVAMPWATGMDKMMPKVRVWEDENAFHLRTRLPSNNPGNVEVSVNDNYMTIKWKAEIEKSAGDTADGYHMWSAATSHRTVMLPPNADAEGAEALIKDGTLEIIMPKRQEQDKDSRVIQVRREN